MGNGQWWRDDDAPVFNLWEETMKRSRLSHARERRAAPKRTLVEHAAIHAAETAALLKMPGITVVRKPTGGGRFFKALPRGSHVPEVEHIRDVFRRALAGTPLGKRLGEQA